MKVSLKWLRDFVDIDLDNARVIADGLTNRGLEIEAVDFQGKGLDNVVVGKILALQKHPDADKLSLLKVNIGSDVLQIVCGASNMKEGDKIAVALVGANLPNGLEIKSSKIRGVESFGMCCSMSELKLAEESEGIIILDAKAVVGTPIVEAMQLDDVILEVATPPNRGDVIGMLGIAREVAALVERPLKLRTVPAVPSNGKGNGGLSVDMKDKRCKRYIGRYVHGVKVKPSPEWMAKRLEAVGLRPINNLVDITNYVMLELGHPLHVFDAKQIANKKIHVRTAADKEEIVLLDGNKKILSSKDMLICDDKRALAIAGVMGGLDSGVVNDTVDVVIECAYFEPSAIRVTSKTLGVASDSSYRFERGVDIDFMQSVVERTTSLLKDLADAETIYDAVDVAGDNKKAIEILVSEKDVEDFLGTNVKEETIIQKLEAIGFKTKAEKGKLNIHVPTFRSDVTMPADIYEEIARLIGFNAIPAELPAVTLKPEFRAMDESAILRKKLRYAMKGLGYNEAITYSFVPVEFPALCNDAPDTVISIKNPITETMKVMRTSMLPSLLEAVKYNINRRNLDIKLFEIGKTYKKKENFGSKPAADVTPAEEKNYLCCVVTGRDIDAEDWTINKGGKADFYTLKGELANLLETLRVPNFEFVEPKDSDQVFIKAHPGLSAVVKCCGRPCGVVGKVHPGLIDKMGMEELEVYFFELDLDVLKGLYNSAPSFKEIPKFPNMRRDLSFLLDEKVKNQAINALLRKARVANLKDFGIFDLYKGKGIPEGKISVAYYFIFSNDERTLTDSEVDASMAAIMDGLKREFLIEIR